MNEVLHHQQKKYVHLFVFLQLHHRQKLVWENQSGHPWLANLAIGTCRTQSFLALTLKSWLERGSFSGKFLVISHLREFQPWMHLCNKLINHLLATFLVSLSCGRGIAFFSPECFILLITALSVLRQCFDLCLVEDSKFAAAGI